MPNPIVPKFNASSTQLTGPTTTQALSLTTGEIATNIDQGDMYIKMRDGSIRNLTPVHSVNTASGLSLVSSEIKALYNTQIASMVESVTVGGATARPASSWQGKTVVEVLDTILFPDLDPTYTVPTLSISGGVSGVQEVGTTINQNFTLTGYKNDAGVFETLLIKDGSGNSVGASMTSTTDSDANIATQFGYSDPNNDNVRYTTSLSTQSVEVAPNSNSWTGYATYAAGLPKQNNKGATDSRSAQVRSVNAPQAAESNSANFASSTRSVSGIYPYFYGTSDTDLTADDVVNAIEAGSQTARVLDAGGTLSIPYNTTSPKFVWLAVPATYPAKNRWYLSDFSQNPIGANQFILAPVSKNVTSPSFKADGSTPRWSNISYKIYISSYASDVPSATPLQFRVS
jgi:hypothetical protein